MVNVMPHIACSGKEQREIGKESPVSARAGDEKETRKNKIRARWKGGAKKLETMVPWGTAFEGARAS